MFSAFVNNRSFFEAFGFYKEQPIIIALLLFNEVLAPVDAVISLLMNMVSRLYEYQAGEFHTRLSFSNTIANFNPDEFAVKLGYSQSLAGALIKLQKENLSSMEADWMYSTFHYSHPILTERLNAIGYKSTQKPSKDADSEKPVKAADREL